MNPPPTTSHKHSDIRLTITDDAVLRQISKKYIKNSQS